MKKQSFDDYYEYMRKITPRLIEAEKTIHEIKSSKEWRRASNYFKVLYQRGYLRYNPCQSNGYKIEMNGTFVQLSDIESILTPDQLRQIKAMLSDSK